MSRIGIVPMVLALLIATSSARAETVEISLAALQGEYLADGETRVVSLQLDPAPLSINWVWLTIRGTATVGELYCDLVGNQPWRAETIARMPDDSGKLWASWGYLPYVAGSFVWNSQFVTSDSDPASWQFLLDGQAELQFAVYPSGYVLFCHPISPPPQVRVDEAKLIVNGDFSVQTEGSTWGRVKALFR